MSLAVLIFTVFLCHSTSALTGGNEGFLEKIKNGLKSMKSYLDTAKGIANMVSNTFKRKNDQKPCNDDKYHDQDSKKPASGTLASAFFRLLGLDSPKIAAITVNSAIFLAQIIGTLFGIRSYAARSTEHDNSSEKDKEKLFDPFKAFIESKNERIQELMNQAQSAELPDQIISQIGVYDNVACIQLLICKTTPIILYAQESLKNSTSSHLDLTSWLPTKAVFEEHAEICERKHSNCKIFPEEGDD